MAENNKKYHLETLQLYVGQEQADPATDSRAVPIYVTISYVFHNFDHTEARFGLVDLGSIYGRLTNTIQGVLEDHIAAPRGGTVDLIVAPGAAAVECTARNIIQSGDHIVAAKNIYGGTSNPLRHTLPRDGITITFIFAENLQELENVIQENTKSVYFEAFGNPNASLPDSGIISEITHKHHLPVVADNIFATPYLLRPLEHGADVAVESATRFIGGHGITLSGVIVEGGKFNWVEVPGKSPTLIESDPSYHGLNFYEALDGAAFTTRVRIILLRDTGTAPSPFAAFLLLQSTEILSLHVEHRVQNAPKVVEYLQTVLEAEPVPHPSVLGRPDHDLHEKYFPNGAGSIFTFDIKDGKDAIRIFIDNLHPFFLLTNVADARSLVIRLASAAHPQETLEESEDQGIHQGTIRLSIGTGNIGGIPDDLKSGFEVLHASGLAK